GSAGLSFLCGCATSAHNPSIKDDETLGAHSHRSAGKFALCALSGRLTIFEQPPGIAHCGAHGSDLSDTGTGHAFSLLCRFGLSGHIRTVADLSTLHFEWAHLTGRAE